jgi:hypothetical protein
VTDEKAVTVKEITAGTVPQMINRPSDCPTIYVDGLQGVSISAHVTKFGLIEHIPGPDQFLGRFVATIAIPNDQFQKVVTALRSIVEQVTPPEVAE